jgi:hypothetical protein
MGPPAPRARPLLTASVALWQAYGSAPDQRTLPRGSGTNLRGIRRGQKRCSRVLQLYAWTATVGELLLSGPSSLLMVKAAPLTRQTPFRRRSATVTTTRPASNTTERTQTPGRSSRRQVESSRGAVPASRPTRFPDPLPEPDMRLPTRPALHRPRRQPLVLVVAGRSIHGFGIFVPR